MKGALVRTTRAAALYSDIDELFNDQLQRIVAQLVLPPQNPQRQATVLL